MNKLNRSLKTESPEKIAKLTELNFMAMAAGTKHLTAQIFETFLGKHPVSGRKTATYYACIKYVPNTVLNFGINSKIYYTD